MYTQVIDYIKQRVDINREEIGEGLKYSEFKQYSKGNYILRAGEHWRFIGFLNKGFIVTTLVIFLFTILVQSIPLMWFFVFGLVYTVYGHLGFEIYPKGFNRHWFGKWMNTSVSHNLHHQYFHGNYGLYFTIRDRLMGTLRPDYYAAYENLKLRKKPSTEN